MLQSRRGRTALAALAVVAVLITCTDVGNRGRGSRSLTGPAFVTTLAATGELDLSTAGAEVVGPGNAIFRQSAFGTSSGTGLVNPFLKTSTNDPVYNAFNTSGTKPSTVTTNTDTRDLPLSWVPTVIIGGTTYREFRLDINEPTATSLLSLDSLKIYITDQGNVPTDANNLPTFPAAANATLGYNLDDATIDSWLKMDATLSSGSGGGDVFIYIPETAFGTAGAACPYDGAVGTGCGKFLYLVVRFGVHYVNNGGFEEFAVRRFPYVTKTAEYRYDEAVTWSIDKKVKKSSDVDAAYGTSTSFDLWDDDESGTADYLVSVDKTVTRTNNRIEGVITVHNPTNVEYTGVVVTDEFNGTSATVTCPGATLATGSASNPATLVCTYLVALGAAPDLPETNIATATFPVEANSSLILSLSGTAVVAGPGTLGTTTGFQTVNVTDTYGGVAAPLGSASDDHTFDVYSRTSICPDNKGDNPNIAKIEETEQTAAATVAVRCYTLNVSKTAVAARTTEFTWTILKQVKKAGAADATYAASTSFSMIQGDQAEVAYRVGLTRTTASDQSKVTGVITITNPATSSGNVVVRNVADQVLDQASAATITGCATSVPAAIPIPATGDNTTWHTLAANSFITCNYTYDFPAGAPPTGDQTNRATVVGAKPAPPVDATKSFTDDEVFNFLGVVPTIVGFASVNVGDPDQPVPNPRGPFSGTDSYVYNKTFTCNTDDGAKVNTATIVEIPTLFSSATVNIACFIPEVTKTATTTFTKSWDWTILKEAGDNPGAPLDDGKLNLAVGQTYSFNYKVTVGIKSGWPQDGEWKVSGMINVANPAPPGTGVKIKSVTDEISSAPVVQPSVSNCTVDAAAVATPTAATPYVLDGGKTLICEYGPTDLQDGTTRMNTATAVKVDRKHTVTVDDIAPEATRNYSNDDIDNVVFGATPTKKVDNCVNVSDLQADPTLLGTVCEDDDPAPPKSFTYSLTIGPFAVCGAYDFPNTASFTSDGASEFSTPRTGESRFNVPILVACAPAGCTLTQGYWKTHNTLFGADKNDGRKGPPIHDWSAATAWTTWEFWRFFGGTPAPVPPGVTAVPVPPVGSPSWFATFTTQPKGNPYYQAAHQFMAAMLNGANGADGSSVGTELGDAYTFFLTAVPGTTWSRGERTKLIGWNSLFASYNEGTLIGGPPHCDEDGTSAR